MTGDRWTAEDVELVARTQWALDNRTGPSWDQAAAYGRERELKVYRLDAEAVLAALADAGRLLPAGSQRKADRYRFRHRRTGQKRLLLVDGDNGDDYVTEKQEWWVGPWLPVQPEEPKP